MNKIRMNAAVNEDGSLTIPAFAVRGLGYEPEEEVSLTIPTNQYICDCPENELFVGRVCGESACSGYTSDSDDLNIPARLLADASIPMGEDVSVLVAEGALLIVATEKVLEDLPVELCCLLNELGISPLTIFSGRKEAVIH